MENKKEQGASSLGKIEDREIVQEMKASYIDYAMSVIVSRALPDVRDGLKPVHRRILYAMLEEGLTHGAKFRKSATVVGSVLGRYHPHGDVAVYDSLVRMAQDFSMRYPLIDGQGNFGCFTKDTKVQLTDGRALSFGELIKEQRGGKRHWTFSFNQKDKKIEIAEIKRPRLTRKNAEVVEVTLDNGEKIRCTPGHRFMLRNGIYQEAKNLLREDVLMSFPLERGFMWQIKNPFVLKGVFDEPQDSPARLELAPSITIPDETELSRSRGRAGNRTPETQVLTLSSDHPAPTASQLYLDPSASTRVQLVRFLKDREDVYDITVDPWHNFALGSGIFVHNSIDGDPAAAMRYSEARMSRVGEKMLEDIEKETVDFADNYDGTRKEPSVLPAPIPQLLLNGTLGIAVGMATNIPPHNMGELLDALLHILENPRATAQDLFQFIKGPDFPTGGIIYNKQDIIAAYSQGKGPIVMRGKAEVQETEKQHQIVITEIPFEVNKSTLVEQFAQLVQDKKIDGIRDIRDESDKDGLRIVFDLQRDSQPQKVLNRLYKFSDLQKTFHLNMLALVDGIQPKVLALTEVLLYFIEHRRKVVERRTTYDLKKAKEREHILEGLYKCLAKIDEVIKIIKASQDREDALRNVMKRFRLTEIQTNAILDMKLAQLARLERKKIEDELKAIQAKIKELSGVLASPKKIDEVVKKEFLGTKQAFADDRKTKVQTQGIGEIAEEDLIPQEETIITLTQGGYIKRINPATYKLQKRGGKGIMGMKTVSDDIVEHFLSCNTHDSLMAFTDSGKVFQTAVYEIPEGARVAKGRGLLNFIELSPQDKVLSLFALGKRDIESGIHYLVMVTKDGVIKKTPLEEFKNARKSGLIAISLKKGDILRSVQKSTGEDELIITTRKGQSIHFKEKDVRSMGRPAAGIHAMRLKKGDEVVGMDVISENPKSPPDFAWAKSRRAGKIQNPKIQAKSQNYLLVLTENGYGKRTDVKEYRMQTRGGSGVKTANVTAKTGNLVYAKVLRGAEEDLIVISRKGQVIRTPVESIPKISRSTQGVRIMRLDEGDKVVSAACL